MKLFYKCKCFDEQVEVEVRERLPDEDLLHWVETVIGMAVDHDHNQRSPSCREKNMEFVKVPMPENAPFLGAKPRMDA
jgi:hypothetical protein